LFIKVVDSIQIQFYCNFLVIKLFLLPVPY